MLELGFDTALLRDAIDLLLVALLLYQLYKLVKGSLAANILLGLMLFYLVYLAVDALQLRLLARILGQFIGVGVISLIILFQPEIRRFLLLIGKNTGHKKNGWLPDKFQCNVKPLALTTTNHFVQWRTYLQMTPFI